MKGPIPQRCDGGESRFARARCSKRFRPKIPAGALLECARWYLNDEHQRTRAGVRYPANICRLLLVLFARARVSGRGWRRVPGRDVTRAPGVRATRRFSFLFGRKALSPGDRKYCPSTRWRDRFTAHPVYSLTMFYLFYSTDNRACTDCFCARLAREGRYELQRQRRRLRCR